MAQVEIDVAGPDIRVVRLNRPERLNAMSIDLAVELDEVLAAVGADNGCRVVVLTGEGRAFCSGLDLKDYGIIPNIDGLSVHRISTRSMRHYSQIVLRLRDIPQPVIAAVNGVAYGGGLCLALGCDLRIAASSAAFNATGIVNGLSSVEMGAGWILPRLLTGRRVDAEEALRMGLVSRVVDDDRLLGEAMEMAETMAKYSHFGLELTKQTLRSELEIASLRAALDFEDRSQLMAGFTDNLPEAIRAFDAGREPVYVDDPRRDLFEQPGPAASGGAGSGDGGSSEVGSGDPDDPEG
jgi:enoyl-CoA hydratase